MRVQLSLECRDKNIDKYANVSVKDVMKSNDIANIH